MPLRYSSRMASGDTFCREKRSMSLTLPPELNTGPSPVTITQRTLRSRPISVHAFTNSSTAVLPVSALRVAGWLMVSGSTVPSRVVFRNAMGLLQ